MPWNKTQKCASLERKQLVAYILPTFKQFVYNVKCAQLFMFETLTFGKWGKCSQFCFQNASKCPPCWWHLCGLHFCANCQDDFHYCIRIWK